MHFKSYLGSTLFLVLFVIIVGQSQQTKAQDIHFTQFDFAPLFINSSNTGNFNGDWRVAGNFRNQWQGVSDPFRTSLISFDKQVFVLNQKLGVGAYFVNDESGKGSMSYNKLYASVGYNTIINNNGIGVGFQLGYVFGNVNSWLVYDPLTGTYTAPNGEPMSDYKSKFLDVNFGLNYKRSISIIHPEVGLSFMHLNMPSNAFEESDEKLALRYNLYSTVKTNISDKIYVTPKFLLSGVKGSSEYIVGTEAGWNLIGIKTTVKRVFGGAYIRNGSTGFDAFMAQVGATIGRLDLGISYDMYLSDISQTGNMSAFEITFIYKSISTILNSYSIPCERY